MSAPPDPEQAHALMVELARGGPGIPESVSLAAFVLLVLRDEETGDRVDLQPYHFDLISALTEHKRLVVDAHVESGKTQIGAMCALRWLGKDPRERIAVGSETLSLAVDIVSLCARYIEDEGFDGCKALREIFPNLLPGDEWRPREGAISVKRPGGIKDPSMRAFGADSGITGRRVSKALLDDYVTVTTTQTPYLRQQQADIFFRKVYGRVIAGGTIIFFNNANWSDDCAAQFASKPGVHRHVMQVTTDGTETGPSNWTARWPQERIAGFIAQNPDYKAQLFCIRRQIGEWGRFDRQSIIDARMAGRGYLLGQSIIIPPGGKVCIGVDFAFGESKKSDACAIVAILVEAPAEGERMGRRTVIDIEAGKWNELDARHRLERIINRYPREAVSVRAESNAGQKWIVQSWGRTLGEIIHPYRTGAKKWDPVVGVPSLSSSFLARLWILPSDQFGHALPPVQQLIDQMNAFDPSKAGREHTGDSLMALFFADGIARESMAFEYRGGALGDETDPTEKAEGPIPQAEAVKIVVHQSDPFAVREPFDMGALMAGFR